MNKIDFAYFMEGYLQEEGVKARGDKSPEERIDNAFVGALDKVKAAPAAKTAPFFKAAHKVGMMKIRAAYFKPSGSEKPRPEDYKRKW